MKIHHARILIVDDEPQNRKLLETLLAPEGYVTTCASSGEDALVSIALHAPDLILLDAMMPGMNGYEVATLLKTDPATASIPIIMVTAQIDRAARLAGLQSGAEEFLTKPVDRVELWIRVRNLLRMKAFSDFMRDHNVILEQEVQARTVSLQRFRTAMDATADAILLVSRCAMQIIEINATACTMFGYTREELFQTRPAQLAGTTPKELEATYDAVIAGHGTHAFVETQIRRKDGSQLNVELNRRAHRFGDEWIIVVVLRDITERKDAEQRLHHLAHYDALTGLPNRMLFYEGLKKAVAQSDLSGHRIAMLFIDLDHFKNVNDSIGHACGDTLLSEVGTRLLQCVQERDTLGRLGGDEFGLTLLIQDGHDEAAAIASQIREALRAPFELCGHKVVATASIGITLYPDDAPDPDTLMRYADTAMYSAKQAGRDTFRFFTAEMNAESLAQLELEEAVRKAVENNEFILYYQPKVQLDSGRICGLEALLRWQRPGHGMVSPAVFIPVLEETGLIVRVGAWVIAEACRQIASWIAEAIVPLQIAVNIAGRQFLEGNLEADVIDALDESRIPADLLELELTETSLMANTERTIQTLQSLKDRGVQISIDDFGTGYSSLAYLRRFPIDKLKIDIAFVRDITHNPDAAAIALTIIRMAHSLKLRVVAEGVETEAQLSYLRRHDCDQIQGYYFSRPVPVHDIEQMLQDHKCLPPTSGTSATKTLLLVDDELLVLTELSFLLCQDGYKILTARSAAEGFDLLALHPVQVVICDQHMPVMSGTDFLDRVKDMYPDTLRIVLSGYTDMESILDAINRGSVYRFYTKPWDNKLLRDNIRDTFQHHQLLRDIEFERQKVKS